MWRTSARAFGIFVLLCNGVASIAGCRINPDPGADLILVNGRVYTLAWGEPSADGSICAT